MNSYIRGNVREVFYKTDKGYMVGIFKIRETNEKELAAVTKIHNIGYTDETYNIYRKYRNSIISRTPFLYRKSRLDSC